MKRKVVTILIAIAFLPCFAQGGFNVDRNGGLSHWTYNNKWDTADGVTGNNYRVVQVYGETKVIELYGDVVIHDRVLVGTVTNPDPSKYSELKIINKAGRDIYFWQEIRPCYTGGLSEYGSNKQWVNDNSAFKVLANAKLTLIGETGRIILDGNSGRTDKSGTFNKNSSGVWTTFAASNDSDQGTWDNKIVYGFIESSGNLEFHNVTIQNIEFGEWEANSTEKGECSAIKLHPWDYSLSNIYWPQGTTYLENVIFQNIKSPNGGGCVMMGYTNTQKRLDKNNRSACKVTFKNCEIKNCQQFGKNPQDANDMAGLIRFRGEWVGDLEMINTSMHNNYAQYNCAGLHWNAIGLTSDHAVLTLDGCSFYENSTDRDCGALCLDGFVNFTTAQSGKKTEIRNNRSKRRGAGVLVRGYYDGDAIGINTFDYVFNNVIFTENICGDDSNTDGQGGAIAFFMEPTTKYPDNTTVNCIIDGAEFYRNRATWQGGGVYISANMDSGKNQKLNLVLKNGKFEGNIAGSGSENNGNTTYRDRSMGGAIHSWKGDVKAEGKVRFEGNRSDGSGGAVAIQTGAKFVCSSLEFEGNKAYRGGAVCLENATLEVADATFTANTAMPENGIYQNDKKMGGAIYVNASSTLTLGKCNFSQNKSYLGGAIYSDNSTININDNAEFNINSANTHGGAVLAYNKSSIYVKKGTFKENHCEQEGGAISLREGGKLEISEFAEFTENSAGGWGGAINLHNDNTTSGYEMSGFVNNATFKNNSALAGGAICVDGNDNGNNCRFSIQNNIIQNNHARAGGGIYIYEGYMTYKGGLLRNNNAYTYGLGHFGTAYQKDTWTEEDGKRICGFGGGLFVAKDGHFSVELAADTPFGIYGNKAEVGGDDITADGRTNSVVLPNVQNLNLQDYPTSVQQSALNWMEDYPKNDPNYYLGTNKLSGNDKNDRYTALWSQISDQLMEIDVASGTYSNAYLNLTLGYPFIYATITKNGLKPGDSSIFYVYPGNESNITPETKPYLQVCITGESGKESVSRNMALTPGEWTVVETGWSYTYKPTDTGLKVNGLSAIKKTLAKENNDRTFTFTNSKQTSAPHAEGVKVNDNMKK